jgi:hypothetical protein
VTRRRDEVSENRSRALSQMMGEQLASADKTAHIGTCAGLVDSGIEFRSHPEAWRLVHSCACGSIHRTLGWRLLTAGDTLFIYIRDKLQGFKAAAD